MKHASLLFFVLFLATAIFAQASLDADALYQQGIEYLNNGSYQKAEAAFEAVLEKDSKFTPALIGLGRVYDALEPGSMQAQRTFNKAIWQNRRDGTGYYYLGLMYTHRPNSHMEAIEQLKLAVHFSPKLIKAWELLTDLHEQNANEKPAVNAFADALLANPQYEPFYQNLLRTAFAYQYENIAIKALNKYIKLTDNPGRATIDLADAHRRRGDIEKAATILQGLVRSDVPWPACKGNLVIAKTYFDQNLDKEGNQAYWRAVDAIKDSMDARLFINDLAYIMQDDEYVRNVTMPRDSLPSFYRRFWLSRDPNLVTQLNERIPEHYRRLSYAETHNRRSYIGYQHSIVLHERDGAFKNVNLVGDEFIEKAHFPKALPRDRTIDDMGVIYIRHGDPDQDIKPNNARSNEYRTWVYYENAERPEMIFHFKRLGEHTGWMLEALPSVTDNMESLHGRYMELQNRLDADWGFSPATRGVTSSIIDASVQLLEMGMETETSGYTFEEEPLNLPVQFLTFKGDSKTELGLFCLVHGSAVQMDESQTVNLNKFFTIHDDNWNELERNFQQFQQQVNATPEQWASSGFVIHEKYNVPAETVHTEFQVVDDVGHRRAVYKNDLTIPDYHQDKLMLSDVLICQEIDPAGSASYERNSIALEPHMFYSFSRDAFVGVYFEIYNLQQDNAGKTFYDVSFTLQRTGADDADRNKTVVGFVKNLFASDQRQVTSQFENEGRTPDDVLYMNLQFQDRDKGEYDLIINVTDKVSGGTSQKRAKITLF